MDYKIIPTVLVQSQPELEHRLDKLALDFDFFQFDIADGEFVPNVTYGNPSSPEIVCTSVKKCSKLSYEAHLMTSNPKEDVLPWLQEARCTGIIFHYESCSNNREITEVINLIKKSKKRVGLAINPDTMLDTVNHFIPKIDLFLVLGVDPGFNGQMFQRSVLSKIKQARSLFPKLDIGVDGGVNEDTLPFLIEAGANIFYLGSYLSKDIKNRKKKLQEIIKKYSK